MATKGISNLIITYSGLLIGALSLLIIQPKLLTKEEVGLVRLLFSFSSILATVAPLGSGNIVIKYFPKFKDMEKKHHGFLGFILIFPLVGLILIFSLLLLFKGIIFNQYMSESASFVKYFGFVFPLIACLSFISSLNTYCYAIAKPTFPSLLNDVIVRLLFLLIILLRHFDIISLYTFVALFVSVYLVQTLAILFFITRVDSISLIPNKQLFDIKTVRPILLFGLTLTVASVSSLSIKYIDGIILAKYLPLSELAVYSVAAFLPTIIEAPVSVIEKIVNPHIAQLIHTNENESLKKIYYLNTSKLLILGCFLFLILCLNLDLFYYFIPDYAAGKPIAIIICFSALFNMVTGVNNAIIFNSDNYRKGSVLLITLLLMAVVFNILLIPQYGLIGAAVATALSSFLYNLSKYVFILIKYRLQPINLSLIVVVMITVVIFLLSYFFDGYLPKNVLLKSFVNTFFVSAIFMILNVRMRFIDWRKILNR